MNQKRRYRYRPDITAKNAPNSPDILPPISSSTGADWRYEVEPPKGRLFHIRTAVTPPSDLVRQEVWTRDEPWAVSLGDAKGV
jgi:hypothetical protein